MIRRNQALEGPILYLDFDGVLHPDEVYRIRGKIVLKCDGMSLFEWAPLLAEQLEPYPDLKIVLSTSWVRVLSFNEARDWLPEALQRRVIGATWHREMGQNWWQSLSRYQQISLHARRHKIARWLAIDDDVTDWPDECRAPLVATDSLLGVAAPDTRTLLARKLADLVTGCEPARTGSAPYIFGVDVLPGIST
jgi:hypothetical protein